MACVLSSSFFHILYLGSHWARGKIPGVGRNGTSMREHLAGWCIRLWASLFDLPFPCGCVFRFLSSFSSLSQFHLSICIHWYFLSVFCVTILTTKIHPFPASRAAKGMLGSSRGWKLDTGPEAGQPNSTLSIRSHAPRAVLSVGGRNKHQAIRMAWVADQFTGGSFSGAEGSSTALTFLYGLRLDSTTTTPPRPRGNNIGETGFGRHPYSGTYERWRLFF